MYQGGSRIKYDGAGYGHCVVYGGSAVGATAFDLIHSFGNPLFWQNPVIVVQGNTPAMMLNRTAMARTAISLEPAKASRN